MPRWIAFLLLIAVAALIAWPIQRPVSKLGQREVVVWGVNLGPDSKGQEAVIREFERRNPEIDVRILSMGAGRMDPQKLMTSIVGNVAPDIVNQDRFTIADWASRNAFRSLNDLIERDKADPNCPTPEKFYEAPWVEASYQGKQYAIPSVADNRILYWNKERFREKAKELAAAGLDPNRPPRTWGETLAYSKVLTEFRKDGTIAKAGFLPNLGDSWLYLYAFQSNASFLSPDGRLCTMATPEAEEALAFMVAGYDLAGGYEKARIFESGFGSRENDPFVTGDVAMKIDGDWNLNSLSRYGASVDIGAAPPPVPDDRFYKRGRFEHETEPFVTWGGGHSYVIPRGARNPNDAWEFIKFATSKEGILIGARAQRDWERLRGRTYSPPISANRAASEALISEFRPADEKFAKALELHFAMAPHAKTRPATIAGQLLWSEHLKAMDAAISHRSTPHQALLASQQNVQRELDAHFGRERYPVIDLRLPVAIGVIAVLLLAALAWIGFRSQRLGPLARTEARWAYLFLSPAIFGFALLTLGPMLASLFFSFTQYDVLNEARWVGYANYSDMGRSDWPSVSRAFQNAAYLAGIGVPLSIVTGLSIALLLNTAARGMRFYRTFFYLPSIVPGVAGIALWLYVLAPDPNRGLVNSIWVDTIGAWFSVSPPAWLTSPHWSKDALIFMGLWGAGSGMILWLAGLKGVPTSLYEAASIDGASPRRSFWSVTVPQLSPIIFFNVVMGFIGAIQEFDRMILVSSSSVGPIGPDDSLLTPVTLLFRNGFAFFKMGYASALAWAIFAVIVALTFVQFKLAPRWVHYEADR